jgi:hypothetical protein
VGDTVISVVVQLSDNRRRGAQLQCRVINVGGGDIDDFKELGHEVETVSGGVQKLVVLGNLVHTMLASERYKGEHQNKPPVTRAPAFPAQQPLPPHP